MDRQRLNGFRRKLKVRLYHICSLSYAQTRAQTPLLAPTRTGIPRQKPRRQKPDIISTYVSSWSFVLDEDLDEENGIHRFQEISIDIHWISQGEEDGIHRLA